MKAFLKRFWRNDAGTVAVIFSVMAPMLVAFVGSGVDFGRAYAARQKLINASESAALAAASLSNERDAAAVVADYLRVNTANLRQVGEPPTITTKIDDKLNSRRVEIHVQAKIPTFFLQIVGVDTLEINTVAVAQEAKKDIEVAMVLDISSSMSGGKLTELKDASNSFVDVMLKDERSKTTSINLIPFGGTVNIGGALFTRLAEAGASATWNPSRSEYNIQDRIREKDFRFSNGDTCVEHRSVDFESGGLIPNNSRPQLPDFWVWNSKNPWCPPDASQVLLNSNKVSALEAAIDGMALSDGTGMDIGAMWGFKTLSPAWRGVLGGDFAERPSDFDDDTMKIMVIMSDGGITPQYRPKEPSPTARVRARWSTSQTMLKNGGWNAAPNSDTASGQFNQVCQQAKADGVIIFTIGFRIKANSSPDRMLAQCASDAGKYYFVEGLDLTTVFNSIAATIHTLRVTG